MDPDRVRQPLGPEGDRILADQTLADWLSHDPDPRRFAADHAQALSELMAALGDYLDRELQNLSLGLLALFNDLSRNWEPRLRWTVLVRVVSFPAVGCRRLPVDGAQRDPAVLRYRSSGSVHTAPPGCPKPAAESSKGPGIHRFEAFFHRGARESDYLWGRPDGAEQLLALLGTPGDSDEATALLAAILDE